MKTNIARHKKCIALEYKQNGSPEPFVLAAIYLFDDSGCWMAADLRLGQYETASPYSCGLRSSALHSRFKPESESDREYVKSLLAEHIEDDDGSIEWCTYDGIIKGSPSINGKVPHYQSHPAGYFSRDDGLKLLLEIKSFWDSFEGDPNTVKIDNPHRQPSELSIFFAVARKNEKELESNNTESGATQLSQG